MVEQTAHFGPLKALVGILAQPAALTNFGDLPAFVILNTGTIHRVGHNRMYVSMSRRLAKAGFAVLRFDFSGLGDSATHLSSQPILQSNFADLKSALDWLETTRSATRVVLVGLCSGADHALLYGFSDPRVVGLILIDPYVPPTVRYFVNYITRRLVDVRSWKTFRLHKSKLARRLIDWASWQHSGDARPHHLAYQGWDAKVSLQKVYEATTKVGIQLLVICTGRHHAPRQTYREQFITAFSNVSFGNLLQLEFLEDADHTFSSVNSRNTLDDLIVDWSKTTEFDRFSDTPSSLKEMSDLWTA